MVDGINTFGYGHLKFCTELEVPPHMAVTAAALAIEENPANAPGQEQLRLRDSAPDEVEMALLTQRYWRPGRTVHVAFLNGDPITCEQVRSIARRWLEHANISLEFVDGCEAEVRISFRHNSGLWSFVGTDALVIDPNEPTMNLAWLDTDPAAREYPGIVLHEFGHALGLTHIHQNPVGGLKWDMPRLYDYYQATMDWNHAQVDRLVKRVLVPRTPFTEYDVASVMSYAIPNELMVGHYSARWNSNLSASDRQWIQMLYPAAPAQPLRAKEAVKDPNLQYRRTYHFGDSLLTIEFGDITSSNADVIVSSDDCNLTMGGGVSSAIRSAGGEAIRIDAAKHLPAKLGDVVVTTAGALPARFVFHAITIGPGAGALSAKEIVRPSTKRCMELLDQLGLETIAFPAIGAGFAGFYYEDVAVEMAQALEENLIPRSRPVHVTIYLADRQGAIDPVDVISFFEQFAQRVPGIGGAVAMEPENTIAPLREDSKLQKRREIVRDLARLTEETQQLVSKMAEGPPEEGSQKRLLDVARRRNELEQQLVGESKPIPSVFISYAHEDERYMRELEKILTFHVREGRVTVWHDRDILPGTHWDQKIRQKLEAADIIIMVVSRDFIYSRYVKEVELARAVERDAAGEAVVIPVIARSCPWKKRTDLGRLQALPEGGQPIADWDNQDWAWTSIDEGLMDRIDAIATR